MKCETCDGRGKWDAPLYALPISLTEAAGLHRQGRTSKRVRCTKCDGRGYRLHGAQLQEARRVMAMAIECVCSAFRWVPSNEAMASDYMDTARQLADRALRICGIDPDEFK